MYSDYSKIKRYFVSVEDLLKTSRTMQDIFLMSIENHRNDIAISYIDDKNKIVKYNYEQYRTITFKLASKLDKVLNGITKKETVALKMKNSPTWIHMFWAILSCGYRVLLIDARLPKDNTELLLKQSHAKAIICDEINEYSVPRFTTNQIEDNEPNYKFAETWANEVIFCSSGTTGEAKMMVFNGNNLCHQIYAAYGMPETTRDIMYPGTINIMALVPFHHIFGFVAVFLWYTFFGKNILFIKSLAPNEVLTTAQRLSATHIYCVPLFWDSLAQNIVRKVALEGPKKAALLDRMIAYNTHKISAFEAGLAATPLASAAVQKNIFGTKVRYCISGGGYISEKTMNIINGIGYPLYNGYGMTEVGVTSVELSPKVENRLKGSIGRPLEGITYKIDPTDEKNSGVNLGELLIKSNITHVREIVGGVEKKPELEDGFLRSGDIVFRDGSGNYFIKGRIKDIIINANGENIYPDEIESYFKSIPHVTNTCVLGVRKGKASDETITLILEVDNEISTDEFATFKDKVQEINIGLANEKRVQDVYVIKDKLPISNNLKVRRFQVKDLLKHKPESFLDMNERKTVKTFEGFEASVVEPVIKSVREIFSKVLLLPTFKVGDSEHWVNELGGDSMSYIQLVGEIEECFGIKVAEEKYGLLVCVNDFAEMVLTYRGRKSK
ncbi:MAG: AMP-binding protein [Bacilli bacterium]